MMKETKVWLINIDILESLKEDALEEACSKSTAVCQITPINKII